MKRTAIANVFVCCLLLMQAHTQIYAQENTMPAQKPAQATHARSLKWEKAEGVEVLKIWELEGKDVFPQVSVLRVSNADYIKFLQDPQGFMNFVNDHRLFSKKIIVAGPWTSLSSVDKAGPDGWTLTLLHGKVSTMLVSALPNFKSEK
jgi:hypothetical protein